MDKTCHQFLHVFSENLGVVILNKFFLGGRGGGRNYFVGGKCVKDIFLNKRIKGSV